MPAASQLSTAIGVLSGGVSSGYVEDADFTLRSYHAGSFILLGNATCTVPSNASVPFPINTIISGVATNATPGDFAASMGVTINSKDSNTALDASGSGFTLIKTAVNTWWLIGDLA